MSDSEIKTQLRRKYYKNQHDPEHFNTKGERRKCKLRPELSHLDSSGAEYHTRHTRLRRAEIKREYGKKIWEGWRKPLWFK